MSHVEVGQFPPETCAHQAADAISGVHRARGITALWDEGCPKHRMLFPARPCPHGTRAWCIVADLPTEDEGLRQAPTLTLQGIVATVLLCLAALSSAYMLRVWVGLLVGLVGPALVWLAILRRARKEALLRSIRRACQWRKGGGRPDDDSLCHNSVV